MKKYMKSITELAIALTSDLIRVAGLTMGWNAFFGSYHLPTISFIQMFILFTFVDMIIEGKGCKKVTKKDMKESFIVSVLTFIIFGLLYILWILQ